MEQTGIKRLYYSISEVSNLVDEEQYVLRYWETEFEQLRPQKNRAGNRIYNEKDIQIIRTIQQLLRIKRFTIDGAKEHLKTIQFDAKPSEESQPQEEHFTEMPLNGAVSGEIANDTAESNGIVGLNKIAESTEIADLTEGLAVASLLQHPEVNPQPAPTPTMEAETPPAATNPSANGETHSFSRTMQAEWYAPMTTDNAALLSIPTLVPDTLHDGEVALASEETFRNEEIVPREEIIRNETNETVARNEAVGNTVLQEQILTEQPLPMAELTTTSTLLPSEANNHMDPESRPSAIFSRTELLDLRDALRQILHLLEPTQLNDSLPPTDTTETTI
ncbi:MAG: MerR family transcriptional regulator [Candidatus Kapabacteria bacterium]|nr:MerR family transcriptional regulator [Candidatus Kapabacteria bacterium]